MTSLSKHQAFTKRIFDVALSSTCLLFLAIPLFIVFILCCFDTRSFGLSLQKCVGQFGCIFYIFKFKTSLTVSNLSSSIYHKNIITGSSPISLFARVLRHFSIDGLPQLFNILIGDMSFVGPKPQVLGCSGIIVDFNRILLSVKPGITSPASIIFRYENTLHSSVMNPVICNENVLYPAKREIDLDYISNWSLSLDIRLVLKSLACQYNSILCLFRCFL